MPACSNWGLTQTEGVFSSLRGDAVQDAMISEHEIVENGDGAERCQVVRWERTFPFSFLSKREYIIGRRMFRGSDGCLYGITKVYLHPSAALGPHICTDTAGQRTCCKLG